MLGFTKITVPFLSFILKLCEKIVVNELNDYISIDGADVVAYRRTHSTKTAFLRILYIITFWVLYTIRNLLLLSYLSAAFDKLKQSFLKHLTTRFCIKDLELRWIQPYLNDKFQRSLLVILHQLLSNWTLVFPRVTYWVLFYSHYTTHV